MTFTVLHLYLYRWTIRQIMSFSVLITIRSDWWPVWTLNLGRRRWRLIWALVRTPMPSFGNSADATVDIEIGMQTLGYESFTDAIFGLGLDADAIFGLKSWTPYLNVGSGYPPRYLLLVTLESGCRINFSHTSGCKICLKTWDLLVIHVDGIRWGFSLLFFFIFACFIIFVCLTKYGYEFAVILNEISGWKLLIISFISSPRHRNLT